MIPGVGEMPLLAFVAIALIAFLYSAVGHAGASGYIAALTLLGVAATEIRPTALLLNIVVATLGTIQFVRAGHFRWRLFWPFALLAVPAAFLGGSFRIPSTVLNLILAAVLLFSAGRLLLRKRDPQETIEPPIPVAIVSGAAIGLLSGLTGTGGGVFLTPLLLFASWARAREAAATSVAFVLVNSLGGIGGYLWSGQPLPRLAWPLAAAAVAGGAAGSWLGSRKLAPRAIYVFLAVVLTIAGLKLLIA